MNRRVLILYRESHEIGPYAAALQAAELEPVFKLPEDTPALEDYAGLVLMGGGDLDPATYGESPHPETEPPDTALDLAEFSLLSEALNRNAPVLAICRGLQLVNVFHGGTLVQHIDPPERHRQRPKDKSVPAHTIQIEPGTLLHSIAGREEWEVNSRHHQAVKDLGQGLRVSARDPRDGVIEALERPDLPFLLAVQWHPENQALTDPQQLRIFQAFRNSIAAT